ncbi:putative bifunctional diguanylate cyclase/phosphodiesterase [Arabiibacter massiliensis]|uniref:putative bifunctional diguanylate cyclase/phosphodiesterase n=1 Tax=Arabiibacter massiliensis TaxID=1870985 RepID=UPI0009BA1BAD|nr:GGDEF domain-containing phosphodiesterase [Arabiibacter massiliensis]
MTYWSLAAECMALLLIVVMALYAHGSFKVAPTRRGHLFNAALLMAGASIVLNAVCTILLERQSAPHWLLLALNSAYFLVIVWTASLIALYLYDLMLAHVHQGSCHRRLTAIVVALNVAFAALLMANVWTGAVFAIAADGAYVRGPLNATGYAIVAVEVVLALMCYVRNRRSVDARVVRVMRTLPAVVVGMGAFQLIYPELYLNGSIAACALIIILLNFQSSRLGTDSLTRARDRMSFYEELRRRCDDGRPFQIVLVALHDFGSVNNRLGHRTADEALYLTASWLRSFDRKGDVFRYGKVSFALVRPYRGEADAKRALEAVAARFDEPWALQGTVCELAFSCCSLVRDGQGWDPERIIVYLDALITRARDGRLRTVSFDEDFQRTVDRRTFVAEELKRALAEKSFTVVYQPVFSCAEGRFTQAEALVRLSDAGGTPIPPDEFIPLAEQMGLVDEVGWFMLEEACRFLSARPDLPLNAVTVNLSMPQMLDPHLERRVAELLERYGVEPSRLKIEITERVLAENERTAADTMERLARLGVGCHLDDFGTGFSNFALVMKLPFEGVKVDRSLLAYIAESERDRQAVGRLVALFHALGLPVVAEGVETEEQDVAVRALGADRIQGYRYARPLDGDALAELLATE